MQNYFGGFDYEQNMALDPSLFAADNDATAFGSMLDGFDFATDQSHTYT